MVHSFLSLKFAGRIFRLYALCLGQRPAQPISSTQSHFLKKCIPQDIPHKDEGSWAASRRSPFAPYPPDNGQGRDYFRRDRRISLK
jgi:hypothetical protein